MPFISVPSRVLVTGASGFLASHLCRALLDRGHTVVGTGMLKSRFRLYLVVSQCSFFFLVRSREKACFH